jgi:hypothetical protein
MMKILLYVSVGFLILQCVSCGSSRKDVREPEAATQRYRTIAVQKYGPDAGFVFNASKTVVLCVKKSKPSSQDPQQRVSFFVFDLSIDSAIFEDNISDGSVRWQDDFSILVSIVPGIVKSDESSAVKKYGYIFHCRSRKTRSLDASSVE